MANNSQAARSWQREYILQRPRYVIKFFAALSSQPSFRVQQRPKWIEEVGDSYAPPFVGRGGAYRRETRGTICEDWLRWQFATKDDRTRSTLEFYFNRCVNTRHLDTY